MATHIAHIDTDAEGKERQQTAATHCRNVEELTGDRLKPIGLEHLGRLAGLLHDLGKFTQAFDTYIRKSAQGESVRKGSVIHTFTGVIYLLERYHRPNANEYQKMACELVAYAIGAHHGLFDCVDENGASGFAYRLKKDRKELYYDEAVQGFLEQCAKEDEIDRCFSKATEELEKFMFKKKNRYYFGMLCRVVLSALIDADRRDTADFMHNKSTEKAAPPDWERQLKYLENKLNEFSTRGPINQARRQISDLCRRFAEMPGGVYRLDVPTGAGKTLASLRYALAHARQQKQRIFFVIPLLSVIDQNAKVIKEYLADPEMVLEHHSNVLLGEEQPEELQAYELLTENWNAPVVITTLVQLLHTLFLGKTSSIRRMHALCRSVVVIDEIQTLPYNMVSIMNMAINFLTTCCQTTVILCSATQPCLERVAHPIQLRGKPDMVPRQPAILEPFRRTSVEYAYRNPGYTLEDLADFTRETAENRRSILVICNTKSVALRLYRQLNSTVSGIRCFHLSTAMCMQHRIDTLDQINTCLDRKERIICVSTQLVEAGVDFSFACVIRCLAGMDSIAQAAGRCNRGNEYGRICPVYIVNLQDENISYLPDIKLAQDSASELFSLYAQNPQKFGNDLLSPEAIAFYYKRHFAKGNIENRLNYPIPKRDTDLYDMLSKNEAFLQRRSEQEDYPYLLGQAFRTAGQEFHVFEEETADVVVPYGEGKEIIADLLSERAKWNPDFYKKRLADAKAYTISIFVNQQHTLMRRGGLENRDNLLFLHNPFYSKETGLDESGENDSVCMI